MASINLINVNPHYDYWTTNKIKGCRFFIEIRCYHCGCLVYMAAVGSRHQALLKRQNPILPLIRIIPLP